MPTKKAVKSKKVKAKKGRETAKKAVKTVSKKKTAKSRGKSAKKAPAKKTKAVKASPKSKKSVGDSCEDILSLFLELFSDDKLTDTQRKVVAIKAMPESYKWKAQKKRDMAGISKRQWFRMENRASKYGPSPWPSFSPPESG